MRLRKVAFVLVCAVLLAASLPAAAFASSFYNSRSTSADAWFSSWDWDNGEPGPSEAFVDWNISGNVNSGVAKATGVDIETLKESIGWASMWSYTPASGEQPATWTEFTCMGQPPTVLSFGRALGGADLEYLAEGTVNVWVGAEPWVQIGEHEWEAREPDQSSTEMVSVQAEWKAAGPLMRSSFVSRERSAEWAWADRYSQLSRRATAEASVVGASGSVYFQTGDVPLVDAQLAETKSNGRLRGEMPW